MGRTVLALTSALLLVGCAQPTAPAVSPTQVPEPTVTPTEAPTQPPATQPGPATPPPFNLSTPALVIERPEADQESTPEPNTVVLPPAPLAIYRPGPGSQVSSPFQVYGRGGPSFNERVHIRLIGEDGRIIQDQITILFAYPGNAGNFVLTLAFETPWVAEKARLEVSTQDRRTARIDQLVSVDLILLSEGSDRIRPALHGPDKLAILWPKDGAVVEGGTIPVRVGGWTDSDQPVILELLDRSGERLWSSAVTLDTERVGELGSLELEIPYEIPYSRYVQLAVYEEATDIPGKLHYSSIEIWLRP